MRADQRRDPRSLCQVVTVGSFKVEHLIRSRKSVSKGKEKSLLGQNKVWSGLFTVVAAAQSALSHLGCQVCWISHLDLSLLSLLNSAASATQASRLKRSLPPARSSEVISSVTRLIEVSGHSFSAIIINLNPLATPLSPTIMTRATRTITLLVALATVSLFSSFAGSSFSLNQLSRSTLFSSSHCCRPIRPSLLHRSQPPYRL